MVTRLDQLLGFRGGERDRLLAQHVLAGRRRLDRDRHVQMVGQRIVDRLDLGVLEQLRVRAVGAWDAQRLGGRPGALRSRDAIASTRQCALCCIAGITFSMPIFAVLMTPKRTGSMACLPLMHRHHCYIASRKGATNPIDGTQAERWREALGLRQSAT